MRSNKLHAHNDEEVAVVVVQRARVKSIVALITLADSLIFEG
jgi:hypothetical protein